MVLDKRLDHSSPFALSFSAPWVLSCICLLPSAASFSCSNSLDNDGLETLQAEPSKLTGSGPNLLLISVDTLRADHLSSYGYSRPTSPFIDSMASKGHLFLNAFCTMPTTLPSHTSILTGLFPTETGVLDNQGFLREDAITITETLRGRGYSTGAFVSAAPLRPSRGLSQGFDVYVYPKAAQASGKEVSAAALSWLSMERKKPFFCFLHLFEPHTPYSPPKDFTPPFELKPNNRHTWKNLPPVSGFLRSGTPFGIFDQSLSLSSIESSILAYDTEILYADSIIEEVISKLNIRGLLNDTIVVITSDHGETLDEAIEAHGYAFDHGEFLSVHEANIPLIIVPNSASLLPLGKRHKNPVSSVDITPTLFEMLGIEPEYDLPGSSLVSIMRGEQPHDRPPPVCMRRNLNSDDSEYGLTGQEFLFVIEQQIFVYSDSGPNFEMPLPFSSSPNQSLLPSRAPEVKNFVDSWLSSHPLRWEIMKPEWSKDELDMLDDLGYSTGD